MYGVCGFASVALNTRGAAETFCVPDPILLKEPLENETLETYGGLVNAFCS